MMHLSHMSPQQSMRALGASTSTLPRMRQSHGESMRLALFPPCSESPPYSGSPPQSVHRGVTDKGNGSSEWNSHSRVSK